MPSGIDSGLMSAGSCPRRSSSRVIKFGTSEELYEQRGGTTLVSIILPLRGRQRVIDGAMEIVGLATAMDRRLHAAIIDVLVRLGLLLAVTIGLTAFVLQRQVLRPLAHLAEGIRRLGRGRRASSSR